MRYDFGGGVQLSPAYESKAAVACSTVAPTKHFCRHIYGYEEGGANYTYYLSHPGILSFERGGRFGWSLVTKAGGRYEGCAYTGPGRYQETWICDYRANWHTYYAGSYSYFRVFKEWSSVITSQATCAAAWGAWWKSALTGPAAWTGMVRDCGTYPYDPGNGAPAPEVAGLDEAANVADDPAVIVVVNDTVDPELPPSELHGLPPEGGAAGRAEPVENTAPDAGGGTATLTDPSLTVVAQGD